MAFSDEKEELDALAADWHGWKWPLREEEVLAGIVALHDERRVEEAAGEVRWLRPRYPVSRFGPDLARQTESPAVRTNPRAVFRGARRALVERHLETLRILADVRATSDDCYHAAGPAAEAA